jgi:hypothetical protein
MKRSFASAGPLRIAYSGAHRTAIRLADLEVKVSGEVRR